MTKRRRLLMIAYYFPPMGMGGVQRPLKFAKYLPDLGWDVTVVTPQPGEYFAKDETLLDDLPESVEVVRIKSLDPSPPRKLREYVPDNPLLYRGVSMLVEKMQRWARWPDGKIHFSRVAAREAMRLFDDQPFDAVYTTSPPPSIHMAGQRVQSELRIPWVADFRDPWLVSADDWGPTRIHRNRAETLRARFLDHADHILAMNDLVADTFNTVTPLRGLSIIPNGYDEADFADVNSPKAEGDFVIAYYGTVSAQTDIQPVLDVLDEFTARHPERPVRLKHIGTTVGMEAISHPAYESLGYLPHKEAIAQLCGADAVVITLDSDPGLRMTIPGRTYEVLRTLRPILVIAPESSILSQVLLPFHGVWTCDCSDRESALNALDQIQRLGHRAVVRDINSIRRFDRRAQTFQLAGVLDDLAASEEKESE
ncbi:MAG: glycosyltransferase [candidate division Zixibacteria bacterium]|nr:glycosyltransferase [candidate division Zixibacteria bacterium]